MLVNDALTPPVRGIMNGPSSDEPHFGLLTNKLENTATGVT